MEELKNKKIEKTRESIGLLNLHHKRQKTSLIHLKRTQFPITKILILMKMIKTNSKNIKIVHKK